MKKQSFNNQLFEGKKGKLMLELTKSYKGDSRFKLDDRFNDDIDVDKLPQKFRQIAQKGTIEKLQKNKKIKKQKPLIIKRFEPGTISASANVKRAEGIKKYQQGLKNHQKKLKKRLNIQKGIDKIKKAQLLLNNANNQSNQINSNQPKPKFHITVNGSRKQAFKQTDFKLFG